MKITSVIFKFSSGEGTNAITCNVGEYAVFVKLIFENFFSVSFLFEKVLPLISIHSIGFILLIIFKA